jgi:hypothetical protein
MENRRTRHPRWAAQSRAAQTQRGEKLTHHFSPEKWCKNAPSHEGTTEILDLRARAIVVVALSRFRPTPHGH